MTILNEALSYAPKTLTGRYVWHLLVAANFTALFVVSLAPDVAAGATYSYGTLSVAASLIVGYRTADLIARDTFWLLMAIAFNVSLAVGILNHSTPAACP